MRTWSSLLVGIVSVFLLPLLVPYGLVSIARSKRRLKAAAKRSQCPICEADLVEEALALADKQWQHFVRGLHRQKPGVKFRLVRSVDAICVVCGASLRFDEPNQIFETTKPIRQFTEGLP